MSQSLDGQSKGKAPSKSPASLKSAGIGESVQPPHSPDLPRPVPEGFLTKSEPLYDCVVYVIFCPLHQNIATTNTLKSKCVWLPFVPLHEGVTWSVASHEGVSLLIGRNDPEMEAEEAERLAPKYAMSNLNILRIDVGKGRVVHRLTQFVRLEENAVYECCRNTERVFWLPLADAMQATTRITKLWGPEVKTFTQLLSGGEHSQSPESGIQLVEEMGSGSRLHHYLHLEGSWQQTLLKEFKMTEGSVHEVFMEFIEHCYPSTFMSIESLRVYFLKYGIALENERLLRLFNAFSQSQNQNRPNCVDFHEFITSLLCIEPNCPSRLEGRHRFIFRYYDTEKKGQLSDKDLCSLLKDGNQDLEDAKIEQEVKVHLKNRPSLDYEAFVSTFKSSKAVREVCRVNQSLLKQISVRRNAEYKERAQLNQNCEGVLKAKRVTKGTCWSCRVQQYEFANHMVTIDTEGRSVEPNLIPVVKSSREHTDRTMTRSRFSLEYVFSMGSTSSIFLDLIRDFYEKSLNKQQDNAMAGLMTQPQEWNILHKYLSFMCKEMSSLLMQEKKLLKLNAPVIVTGDICGNLNGLIQQLEKQLWQSYPVIPETLLFLGNYSSQFYSHGIECLIYLFALKLCSPNKVFLLRGLAELDATTGAALREQCTRKYGLAKGQIIFSMVLQVFAKMPIAAVLDDTVLCTHSGIPSDRRLVSSLLKLPKDMPNLQKDSRMATEMIRRTPRDTSQFDEADSQYGAVCKGPRIVTGQTAKTANKSIPMESAAMKTTVTKQAKQIKQIKSGGSIKKTLKSKPPVSVKSNFAKRKSIKSYKSQKTKPSTSPPLLLKTFVLTKSSKSKKTSVFEQMIKMKQNEKKDVSQNSYHFEIDANNSVISKGKPMFLTKNYKSSRKKIQTKFSPPPPASNVQSKLKTKSKSLKSMRVDRRKVQAETFDEQEFVESMAANDLSYLIRSGSLCQYGFAITYKHCLSIVSCPNIAQCANQASVVLIDNTSIRTLRFSLSPQNDTTTSKNTNNVNNNIIINNNG